MFPCPDDDNQPMPPHRSPARDHAAADPLAPALQAAVAGEMRRVAALLGQLADTLVGDEEVARRHVDALQAFDLAIQCADESAGVLDRLAAGTHARDALEPVRLTAIQDRLRHALARAA